MKLIGRKENAEINREEMIDFGDGRILAAHQLAELVGTLQSHESIEGFQDPLRDLLNSHGKDSDCNTADHVLAEFLGTCLSAFSKAVEQRDVSEPKATTTGECTMKNCAEKVEQEWKLWQATSDRIPSFELFDAWMKMLEAGLGRKPILGSEESPS